MPLVIGTLVSMTFLCASSVSAEPMLKALPAAPAIPSTSSGVSSSSATPRTPLDPNTSIRLGLGPPLS